MAEKEHRAQDYAEGGLNLKINFRKLKYYFSSKGLNTPIKNNKITDKYETSTLRLLSGNIAA